MDIVIPLSCLLFYIISSFLSTFLVYIQIKRSSKIEQAFETKLEDDKQSYFNEWNEEIKGKKCGFITIHDITEKKIQQYKVLTAKEVTSKLKNEADNQTMLNDEDYSILTSYLKLGKRGYAVKKEDYIENGQLKEDMTPIFEGLQMEYDSENNRYYDLNQEELIYALPLIPEKYFRKKEVEIIKLEQLVLKVEEIEKSLKALFGGEKNEDK